MLFLVIIFPRMGGEAYKLYLSLEMHVILTLAPNCINGMACLFGQSVQIDGQFDLQLNAPTITIIDT